MGRKKKDTVWDSGYEVNDMQIHVDRKVYNIIRGVDKYSDGDEYSVLFKGNWESNGFNVYSEYYVPKQKVTGSSVDYEENLGVMRERDGYNVIVHSHPFLKGKIGEFSNDDMEYINKNFKISLLVNGHCEIIKAHMVFNSPHSEFDFRVELDEGSIFDYEEAQEEIVGLDNIKRKKTVVYDYKRNNIGKKLSTFKDKDKGFESWNEYEGFGEYKQLYDGYAKGYHY